MSNSFAPQGYSEVKVSMSKSQVIGLMGEPEAETPNAELNEYLTAYDMRVQAGKMNANTWMVYYRDVDTYLIGLNNEEKVIGKISGGP
jgi:hypothetical protein